MIHPPHNLLYAFKDLKKNIGKIFPDHNFTGLNPPAAKQSSAAFTPQ